MFQQRVFRPPFGGTQHPGFDLDSWLSLNAMFSAHADGTRQSFSRAGPAYTLGLSGSARTYTNIGAGTQRQAQALDANGLLLQGTLLEPSITNLYNAPDDLSDVFWTKANCALGAGIADPFGGLADTVIPNAGVGVLAAVRTPSQVWALGRHVMWALVKNQALANSDWCMLYVYNSGTQYCRIYFDAENVAVGSIEQLGRPSCADRGIFDIGNDWRLVWAVVDVAVGATNFYTYLYCCKGDGVANLAVDGDGATPALAWAWVQREFGYRMTSPYDGTRVADSAAVYNAPYGSNKQGFLVVPVIQPPQVPSATTPIVTLRNSATPAADYLDISVHTDGTVRAVAASTGGNAGLSTVAGSICNRQKYLLMVSWAQDHLQAAIRDCYTGVTTEGTIDTSFDPPVVDQILVQPSGGLTGQVKVYPRRWHSFTTAPC